MNFDENEGVVAQLRAGIERIPAEVQPGLARRAYQHDRRRRTVTRVVAGSGTVAAAAVAVALVATSSPQSGSAAPAAAAPAAQSPLMTLAAHITANHGPQSGNASLIVSTQTGGNLSAPVVQYDLYTDSGAIYSGDDSQSLLRYEVTHHDNSADGTEAAMVAAAKSAATGNLTTARTQMALASGGNPLGLGLSPAARQKVWDKGLAQAKETAAQKGVKIKLPSNPPTGQALQNDIDNYVWINSLGALTSGGGDTQVRAGVLRLLSSIPAISVEHTTTSGQPTLTVTASAAVAGINQTLVINAQTGLPISLSSAAVPAGSNGAGLPASTTTYQVTQTTVANIEAGKF
jgi:hypothetical protein